MNSISEYPAATALMVMLLGPWVIVATAPRYSYVSSVEYEFIRSSRLQLEKLNIRAFAEDYALYEERNNRLSF